MSGNSETPITSQRSKTKRNVTARVKWTEDMEMAIFDYGRNSLQQGKGFEKPIVNEFYRGFLAKADPQLFSGVTLDKLVQHMRVLKASYTSALNWRNKTGQGILDDDPTGEETVRREMLRRCKHFDVLDEIFGDRPQFNPPYIHHSDENRMPPHTAPVSVETSEDDHEESMVESPNSLGDILLDEDDVMNESEVITEPPSKRKIEVKSDVKKKLRKSPIRSTLSALEGAMQIRAEAEMKRIEWESQSRKIDQEEASRHQADQMHLQNAKLDFEKHKWNEEIHLRTESENKRFELEKLKIMQDAEIAKMKMEKDFELEKLRIHMSKQ